VKIKDAYVQMISDRFALRHAWEMIHGQDDDRGESDNYYINRVDICDETPDIDWEFEEVLDMLDKGTREGITKGPYSKTRLVDLLLEL